MFSASSTRFFRFGFLRQTSNSAKNKRPPDIYPGGLLKCGGEGTPAQGWENAVIFLLLPLHADNRLQHGVGSGDGLAVGLEAALCGDHLHEFRGHVHVGLFQRIAVDGAEAGHARRAGFPRRGSG